MSKKFSLSANPTFKSKVKIPVPGGKSADIEFTFKHKTRDEFKDFLEGMGDREDLDVIMEIACGWDLDDAFEEDNVEILIQNYPASARAVAETYITELAATRRGN